MHADLTMYEMTLIDHALQACLMTIPKTACLNKAASHPTHESLYFDPF
jgi:hypothetical protein